MPVYAVATGIDAATGKRAYKRRAESAKLKESI
jgi:hypothetical protein